MSTNKWRDSPEAREKARQRAKKYYDENPARYKEHRQRLREANPIHRFSI